MAPGGSPAGMAHLLPPASALAAGSAAAARPREKATLQRLGSSRARADAQGLRVEGFLAPGWLFDDRDRVAAAAAGFAWACTSERVVALPGGQAVATARLVFGARARWLAAASALWTCMHAWRARGAPVLRLELHPDGVDSPVVRRCWTRLLARALHDRRPLKLGDLAVQAREAGTPPAQGSA
jgi:predicted deacetylase